VKNIRGVAGIGIAAVAVVALAACSSNDTPAASSSSPAPAPAPASSSSAATSAGDGVTTNADVFGPACSGLPQGDAPGGLNAMGSQPVASAASTNPLLKTLVAAVQATNLVDPLNSAPSITVFAPADAAFTALGADKVAALVKDPATLAPILKYHVVPTRYDAKGLIAAGSVPTLDGDTAGTLKIGGTADAPTVNGNPVLCGNIPTKNATVFVIGKVLTPGTNKS
jgi:uncharacterized surface protein with fasciclin (FAS1) repeats